ncbi:MAG: hypothetical protein C0631_09410 [Sedimenticola sp.]|nr:MAG: hypothetical protein C0631_09410 [Sedimenticola sp.]
MSQIANYSQAVYLLSARDLKQRSAGSYLGWLWLVLQPAFMLLIYTFVFGVILKVRFQTGSGTGDFALYLMAGLFPFNAFREAADRSTSSLTSNRQLIQRVVFPPVLLPLVVSMTSLVTEIAGLAIVALAVLVMGEGLTPWVLMFPLLMLARFLLNLGVGWVLSVLNVFFRDMNQLIGMLLTLLFFGTPIIYPASLVPEKWVWIYKLNPFYHLVSAYRSIFIEGIPPEVGFYIVLVLSAVIALLGLVFFSKTLDRAKDLL